MNILPINKVEGQVVAGNIVTVTLPLGLTYDKVFLELSGTPTAPDTEVFDVNDIDTITLKGNGRIVSQLTAADIQSMADYKGIYNEAGVVTIDFTEPVARGGGAEQLLTTIPSGLFQNLILEIKIKSNAALPGNGSSKILAYAQTRAPSQNPFIVKFLPFNVSFSAASTKQPYYLPIRETGAIIKRVWLFQSDIIDAIEIRNNQVTLVDASKARLEIIQKENELVPASGLLVADFVADGNITTDALNTIAGREATLFLDLNGAGSIRGYLEVIDPVGRL